MAVQNNAGDTTPPAVNWSNEISATDDIVFEFNETVQLGSGAIEFGILDSNSEFTSLDSTIVLDGSTLTINPDSTLSPGLHYSAQFHEDSILDLSGNDFNYNASEDITYSNSGYDVSVVSDEDPTPPSPEQVIQVRSVEAMSQLQASINEHGADYVGGSTEKVVKFELWLDASELAQLDAEANEIFDFSFDIAWNDAQLQALGWGVTGDQLGLDNSFVSYNYNNANDMAITFNPDNNGVASIAFASPNSVVDTLTPMFGVDQKGAEILIATFYAAPDADIETINISIENMSIGTNLAESLDLNDFSVSMDTSTVDATIQTDETHYLDNVSLHYIDDEGNDTGTTSLIENGNVELDQSVDFDVVTLSESAAYSSGVQTNDATAILKHIVGLDTLVDGSVNIHAADVNNSGSVQTNDATAILRHIVGLDSIDNFDLIDNSTGQRVTHIDGNSDSIAALTIVENGDVNQSGSFNDDYTVLMDMV